MRARTALVACIVAFGLASASASANYHPEFGGRIPAGGSTALPVKSCPTSHLRVQSHVPVFLGTVHSVRVLVNPHAFSAGFLVLCDVFTK